MATLKDIKVLDGETVVKSGKILADDSITPLETAVSSLQTAVAALQTQALGGGGVVWTDENLSGVTRSVSGSMITFGDLPGYTTDMMISLSLKRVVSSEITQRYNFVFEVEPLADFETVQSFIGGDGSYVLIKTQGGSNSMYIKVFDYDGSSFVTDEIHIDSLKTRAPGI